MKNIFIIVAGGSGVRMNATTPKQFIELGNKTILHHTISTFYLFDSNAEIIVVLPSNKIDEWKTIIKKYNIKIPHTIISGGEERFYSVRNAIESINCNDAIVSIHDGVRPLVNHKTINNCIEAAKIHGASIPVVELKESIRLVEPNSHKALDRKNYRLVQTPQSFKLEVIKKAYTQLFQQKFTDDASVVEKLGVKISLVEGNYENIKITTPSDLIIAESILKNNFLAKSLY
ncbi:MAG: 2-C-methyl-D-erythritol 4-phosphate cytidylyltransferase [Bacteroidota bacterium]